MYQVLKQTNTKLSIKHMLYYQYTLTDWYNTESLSAVNTYIQTVFIDDQEWHPLC